MPTQKMKTMQIKKTISDNSVRRLPKYLKKLYELTDKGQSCVSSAELAAMLVYTPSQIRQDLNYYGSFGQPGYGYKVEDLIEMISGILRINMLDTAIVVGAGKIGQALMESLDFASCGVDVLAAFDSKSELWGSQFNGIRIHPTESMAGFLVDTPADLAVLCVSRNAAQRVAEELVKRGVKSIWNFTNVDLTLPNNIKVENIHLMDSLMALKYYSSSNTRP